LCRRRRLDTNFYGRDRIVFNTKGHAGHGTVAAEGQQVQEAQNLGIVQSAHAAFGRGEIETLLTYLAEDIVWRGVYGAGPHVPTAGESRGKPAVAEFFKQLAGNVVFSHFEPKDFIATGDKVVALGHYTATTPINKGFDSDFAMVFTLRDGKVTQFQEFCDSAAVNEAYTPGVAV
jgi:ketosteroid isomerase-like protein